MGDADRIVAAELGHVDVGSGGKGFAIANFAKAPDCSAVRKFQFWTAEHHPTFGIESDRLEAVDGKAGMPIDQFFLWRRRVSTAKRPPAPAEGRQLRRQSASVVAVLRS